MCLLETRCKTRLCICIAWKDVHTRQEQKKRGESAGERDMQTRIGIVRKKALSFLKDREDVVQMNKKRVSVLESHDGDGAKKN